MRMRGSPESRSTVRTIIVGRKERPNCSKRGAKSVIRTAAPLPSRSVVTRIAVFSRYCCSLSRNPSSRMSKKPPASGSPSSSSLPPRREWKTGSPSKWGRQAQQMRPRGSISAPNPQLPITPPSSGRASPFVMGPPAARAAPAASGAAPARRPSRAWRRFRGCRPAPARRRWRPRLLFGRRRSPSSSVMSSPMNTGTRPRNGASAMKSSTTVRLFGRCGLSSSTILPSCTL